MTRLKAPNNTSAARKPEVVISLAFFIDKNFIVIESRRVWTRVVRFWCVSYSFPPSAAALSPTLTSHHRPSLVSAPPYPPEVLLIGSSNNSIEVRLKPDANDSVPLFGFTLHYKAAFGEWETIQVPKKVS